MEIAIKTLIIAGFLASTTTTAAPLVEPSGTDLWAAYCLGVVAAEMTSMQLLLPTPDQRKDLDALPSDRWEVKRAHSIQKNINSMEIRLSRLGNHLNSGTRLMTSNDDPGSLVLRKDQINIAVAQGQADVAASTALMAAAHCLPEAAEGVSTACSDDVAKHPDITKLNRRELVCNDLSWMP